MKHPSDPSDASDGAEDRTDRTDRTDASTRTDDSGTRAANGRRTLDDLTDASDLDAVLGELVRIRREMRTLERLVGLPGGPIALRERRAKVVELRAAGHSERSIAQALRVGRGVVTHDLRVTETPTPAVIVGLDGRTVRGPRSVVRDAVT